ncbi:Zn-dependent amino-or carboxypeptidase, M28 family [Haloplanus vescus]|uniref:Carboxypeptidase Q n=1 Tax=Haloplanus vescus TaxID=555874 RepID=A0A1H3WJ32_9EURY|nr:M28 family peptidase [Haloplanus vescus]SDZ87135.1 Zn-dependent amino-or carboxypeptidase, M28 family [Haloplanus vescus]
MHDWIGETFTSDAGWDHLERLVDIGSRMAGTPGEREALEATRDALDDIGARDAHIDDFEIQGWVRGSSHLDTPDGDAECIALPRSPADTAAGRLVDCGDGLPEDFEDAELDGAIALVSASVPDHYDRFIHRREKYYRAVEAGAVGFVFRNHVPGCLAPTGSVGTDDTPLGPIPAVGVSREVGARLARRFAGDRVTLTVDCETPTAESGVVRADIGPDTDRAVYLTSHVDAHDIAEGAVDNGAGTATVLEVARALLARDDPLGRRVRVVCFGAEEVGLRGSKREADLVDADSVQAVVNCDGVGRGRTLQFYTHGFDALGQTVDAVADDFGHPVSRLPSQHPHSDHWPFVARGVPALLVSSDDGDRGRGWGHTRADTLDKLERRTLREGAILVTGVVAALADADHVDHRDPDAIAAALEREDHAEGMRVTGDWPF